MGHELHDLAGEFIFEGAGRTVAGALGHGFLQGSDDTRVGMAEDQGAPGEDVIDVAIAIDVE